MPNAGDKTVPTAATLLDSHLGKKIDHPQQYDPSVLFAIARAPQRKLINMEKLKIGKGH